MDINDLIFAAKIKCIHKSIFENNIDRPYVFKHVKNSFMYWYLKIWKNKH